MVAVAAGAYVHGGRVGRPQYQSLMIHGVEGVGKQVEQHSPYLLGHHAQLLQVRVEGEGAGHHRIAVLALKAVVSQAQVVAGHGVQIDGLALAGIGVGVLQHSLHDIAYPRAVLVDFVQVLFQVTK